MKRIVLTLVFFAMMMFAGSVVSANNCEAEPTWFEVLKDSGWSASSNFYRHSNGWWVFDLPKTGINGVWGRVTAPTGINIASASWDFWEPEDEDWVSCSPNNYIDGRHTYAWYTGGLLDADTYAAGENLMQAAYQTDGYGCPNNVIVVEYYSP